ncbi:myo-inositol-1(or 4)-monophosphatase [Actinocorallia herbida]|uniref:Inositol-1-monophosphatase n=1 Tax=Actinocorallia herbida TaxID=58109 RepID=A0A3N1D6V8_9ACTN|nr:inositol monophosphatase family protein [Actinocorallia herbida]ROO89267.1 myo-inositol-1(or 4)-monophosphatase [Actinocorallia herbida]
MTADPDHLALLDLAVATARETGRMLIDERPAGGPDVVATKSSATDVVTQMDRAAERLVRARIGAARPGDAFLGEEEGDTAGSTGVRWVVDPIDGTVNYLYDLPDWAVSIAAEVDGAAVAGVVEVPRRGWTFTAVRGGGAFLNGEPIRCTSGVPLQKALVATGFGYEAARRAAQARVLAGVLPNVRDIRRNGAAAIDLCQVAAGRLDGYYERGVHHWDIAAGSLIVIEAGGRVGGLDGAPAGNELTIAAGAELFGPLHDLLAPLGPARD